MIAIPNMSKPKRCGECDLWSNCFYPKNPYTEQDDYIAGDCPLIDIVTCGECKWFIEQGKGNFGKCTYRTRPMLYCLPTDFCSYAERK